MNTSVNTSVDAFVVNQDIPNKIAKNIEEHVVNEIVEYAYQYEKLKRKYDDMKKEFHNVRCTVCKKYQRTQLMGKKCGHSQCHNCHFAETSLIFDNSFDVPNRNECIKCWIKLGYATYNEVKKGVSNSQWEHYKSYTICLEKKFQKK